MSFTAPKLISINIVHIFQCLLCFLYVFLVLCLVSPCAKSLQADTVSLNSNMVGDVCIAATAGDLKDL